METSTSHKVIVAFVFICIAFFVFNSILEDKKAKKEWEEKIESFRLPPKPPLKPGEHIRGWDGNKGEWIIGKGFTEEQHKEFDRRQKEYEQNKSRQNQRKKVIVIDEDELEDMIEERLDDYWD